MDDAEPNAKRQRVGQVTLAAGEVTFRSCPQQRDSQTHALLILHGRKYVNLDAEAHNRPQ